MSVRSWSLLWLVVATACPAGGPGGSRFSVVSEGEGAENEAPLDPFQPGTVLFSELGNAFIDLPDTATSPPTERFFGDRMNFTHLASGAEGLFITGSADDGPLATPPLLVPARVRVGMQWNVWVTDASEPDYEFEVFSRQVLNTPWGRVPVWEIGMYGAARVSLLVRYYAEGHGLLGLSDVGGTTVFGGFGYVPAVVSDEPEPGLSRPTNVPVLLLRPLPWADGVVPYDLNPSEFQSLGMVRPAGSARATIVVRANDDMYYSRCLATDGLTLQDQALAPGRAATVTGGECPTYSYCYQRSFNGSVFNECVDRFASTASGARVTADGVVWLPRTGTGLMGYPLGDSTGVTRLTHERYWTTLRHSGGSTSLLYTGADPYGRPLLFTGGDEILSLGYAHGSYDATLDDPLSGIPGGITEVVTLESPDEAHARLLVRDGTGIWSSAVYDNTGVRLGARLGRLPGTVSVLAKEGGGEVLVAQPDGYIDEVQLEGDGLVRTALARVIVPDGERVVGAFRFDAKLLVFTILPATGPTDTGFGLRMYEAIGFTEAAVPVPVPSPRSYAVSATGATGAGIDDVRVCWPPAFGAPDPDPSKWKLGGLRVRGTFTNAEDPGCITLARDFEQLTPPRTMPPEYSTDWWLVTGPVPGLGRTTLTAQPAFTPVADLTGAAQLTDGAFVTQTERFDANGDLRLRKTLVPVEADRPGYGNVIVDSQGNGLWRDAWPHPEGSSGPHLALLGRTTRLLPVRYGDTGPSLPHVVSLAAHGGGVLAFVNGRYDLTFISPDGVLTDAPSSNHGTTHATWHARLSDGTWCGPGTDQVTFARVFACRSPDGTWRETPPGGRSIGNSANPVTADGRVVFMNYGSSEFDAEAHLLDPADMSFTLLGRGEFTFNHDKDGRLWMVLGGVGGWVDATGFHELELGRRWEQFQLAIGGGSEAAFLHALFPIPGGLIATVGHGFTANNDTRALLRVPTTGGP